MTVEILIVMRSEELVLYQLLGEIQIGPISKGQYCAVSPLSHASCHPLSCALARTSLIEVLNDLRCVLECWPVGRGAKRFYLLKPRIPIQLTVLGLLALCRG